MPCPPLSTLCGKEAAHAHKGRGSAVIQYVGIFHERRIRSWLAGEAGWANLRSLTWFATRAAGHASDMRPFEAAEPLLLEGVRRTEDWIRLLRAMDNSCPYPSREVRAELQ